MRDVGSVPRRDGVSSSHLRADRSSAGALQVFRSRAFTDLLIFANSYKKHPGRCIAGREIVRTGGEYRLGRWIRPVSGPGEAAEGSLLPDRHCRTDDGRPIRPLDVLRVPLADERPAAAAAGEPGQPENRRVRPGVAWRRHGRLDASIPGLAEELVDDTDDLWGDGDGGRADRILASRRVDRSLMLVKPRSFEVVVTFPARFDGGGTRRRVEARFEHGGLGHRMSLTDDVFIDRIVPRGLSRPQVIRPPFGDRCLLCLSLGVPFHGYRYKLVAGVIPIVPFPGGA